ncbi:hypothetical protein PRK78_004481 [Emydomyces testavorans]|uniref:CFEM domain-containing protein n=1 Tax=Emydomyces testavorans TaxID=2070801 RepID=A0AAF0DIM2_9EURO|nr:hypothetical protein PRK78_004481 [Emydomyces testavorans]
MKLTNAFIAAILAGGSLAVEVPACSKRCFDNAASNRGCNVPVEYTCLCVASPISNDFYRCIWELCGPADRTLARNVVNKQCGRPTQAAQQATAGNNEAPVKRSEAPETQHHSTKQAQKWKKVFMDIFDFAIYCLTIALILVICILLMRFGRAVLKDDVDPWVLPQTENRSQVTICENRASGSFITKPPFRRRKPAQVHKLAV